MSDIRDPNYAPDYAPTITEALADPAGFVEGMAEVKPRLSPSARFDDPECLQFLADLRALSARADALKAKYGWSNTHVSGLLWGITRALDTAVVEAESELTREEG